MNSFKLESNHVCVCGELNALSQSTLTKIVKNIAFAREAGYRKPCERLKVLKLLKLIALEYAICVVAIQYKNYYFFFFFTAYNGLLLIAVFDCSV